MAPSLVKTTFFLALGALVSAKEHLVARDLTPAGSAKLPTNWRYYGCYLDTGNPRTLASAAYTNTTGMTDESCATFCKGNGYIFAGVEYSQECYCGNYFMTNTTEPSTDCSMACTGDATEPCGGPNRMSIFWSGATPPAPPGTNPGPPGWYFTGCYTEGMDGRTLTTAMAVPGGASNMSVAACTTACKASGFSLSGVEYGQECYCGNSISNGGVLSTNQGDCSTLCTGNSSEYCGAGNRLDLYSTSPPSTVSVSTSTASKTGSTSSASVAVPTGPVHVASVGKYIWIGCYTEATGMRALTPGVDVNYQTMTVEICASYCSAYTYFGVEYSGECYCGNSPNPGSTQAATTDCAMLCDGNSNEYCGGPNRLDLYQANGTAPLTTTASSAAATSTPTGPVHVPSVGRYKWIGCYTEANGVRALTPGVDVDYQTMTVEICAAYCSAYAFFGVEYGGECYCGSSPNTGSVLAATTDCAMLCDGNANEYCGGPNRLDLYQANGTAPTATTSSGTTATSSLSIGSSSATGLPTGWKYGGCFVDNMYGRIMRIQQPDNQQSTVESCVNTCAGLGYTVAGIEYGVQCFCDNSVLNAGALAANQADCNTPCPGNTAEMCGAGNRMNVYYKGNLTLVGIPVEQTSGIQSWTYKGCRTDNVVQGQEQVRTLPWQLILVNNNTASNCLLQCSEFGYNAGGMEYGEECYCGDIAAVQAGLSTLVDESQCATACSGNASEICGDGNRLSYYEWTGTPLYNWHTPTGYLAGEYQFLIGGLCVPLISTPGVNGKVQFLEKYGTSPNASSTGAYELDLSQIDDFENAWRPMHVKSDVFCSASLTLPDKVGRQINIGGWAEESVFGIRLYWPDGSPGVASVNDWQENYEELALQTARWYPSAMIMTNGSILVVGGEVGSNSAPSPTLELLPATGGGLVYCDWLYRTDPNNLYPFLAVVPSGGILVIYYNEARILDPGTFDTIKVLPNLPGNVNNFLAGRTYPLEGTAVLLPQVAPYGDPLTVLVCGGSTIGGGQASDNCVSTQPDATNPTWTIERMPSQRVMSCICALPDGTYLILNGAHQGVAGFGLATSPNLQAVLYDPTLAPGSRMSIMASTIVARLYHSEATLLQDGRVIVSGSDPQDGVNPEEYRVEVFMPPYLLSGAIAPTLTVAIKDWGYNQPIPVTINLPTGNVANVKFSLLGAVSSTHGNSMGQRTIFPAFTCSSPTSCTITAPPGANVCPMGWFQLFVLDGPTPGTSTWVRIGGDPGKLGNWPDLPDFDIPGE